MRLLTSGMEGALCQVLGGKTRSDRERMCLTREMGGGVVSQAVWFILLFIVSLAIDQARAMADGQTALWQ